MAESKQHQFDGASAAFHKEEVTAYRSACIGRGFALVGIAILTGLLAIWPAPLFIWAVLLLFFANSYLAYRAADAAWGRSWHRYAIVFMDFALLSFVLVYPNPLAPADLPPQINLRSANFIYFFVLLSGLAYLYSPRLVLWGGLSGAFCWTAGVLWLAAQPGATWRPPGRNSVEAVLEGLTDPYHIDLGVRVQEATILLITAGLIALGVSRMRAMAIQEVEFAEQRANLARYFPRKTADYLATKSNPFTTPREQQAAVLFADLVGFTAWAERQTPATTIACLRQVHGMLADIVFDRNGTIDKFIGDGLMASFGTPAPTGRDATNALGAALDMADTFERLRRMPDCCAWNTLRLSVGTQFGTVIVGDIGSAERLEFATLGDVVNVASRLESATRLHDCRVLVGKELVDQARAESGAEADALIVRLAELGAIAIDGRVAKEEVYAY